MALDNQQGYTDIKKKTTLSQKYRKVKKDIKDLEKNTEWNLVNLFNFHTFTDKPSSSGITIINKR